MKATEAYLLEKAYLLLLSVPHWSDSRARIQSALASLRDEIARRRHWTPEQCQSIYEQVAEVGHQLDVDADELARGWKVTVSQSGDHQ